jgi:Cu/Ag efflux pump CusA
MTKGLDPAFVHFSAGSSGKQDEGEIIVDVQGDDLVPLDQLTRTLAKQIGEKEGLKDVVLRYKSPRPEMQVVIDREKTGLTGLTSRQIGDSLRNAIQGGVATKLVSEGQELDVRVRFKQEFRDKPDNINDIFLKIKTGEFVPVKEIARMEKSTIPVKIFRKNKRRTYSFSVRPRGITINQARESVRSVLGVSLPPGFRAKSSDEAGESSTKASALRSMLVFGSLLVFMVLSGWFESVMRPLGPLLLIPMMVSIALTFMLARGLGLSFGAVIGLTVSTCFAVSLLLLMPENSSRLHNRQWLDQCVRLSAIVLVFVIPGVFFASGLARNMLVPACLCAAGVIGCAGFLVPIFALSSNRFLSDPRLQFKRARHDLTDLALWLGRLPRYAIFIRYRARLIRRYFKSLNWRRASSA